MEEGECTCWRCVEVGISEGVWLRAFKRGSSAKFCTVTDGILGNGAITISGKTVLLHLKKVTEDLIASVKSASNVVKRCQSGVPTNNPFSGFKNILSVLDTAQLAGKDELSGCISAPARARVDATAEQERLASQAGERASQDWPAAEAKKKGEPVERETESRAEQEKATQERLVIQCLDDRITAAAEG
jgi:hypothetical protein